MNSNDNFATALMVASIIAYAAIYFLMLVVIAQ
jgi:hypothetical protein